MARKPATCDYPGCGIELPDHRPYAGSGILSATEIVSFANLGNKADSFAWAASEVAATYAVHEMEERWSADSKDCTLSHKIVREDGSPGLCGACKLVRYEFKKRWNDKANKGTHVHHLAVNWAMGKEITADASLDPYFDDLELFYKQYHPKWLFVERSIHGKQGPREWVGTFDAIAEINCPVCPGLTDQVDDAFYPQRCIWLLDIKTGSKWELEWRLQMSAYLFANSITRWEDGKEIVTERMPLIVHSGALWLDGDRDDPCWTRAPRPLVPLQVDQETHNMFLRLVDLTGWEKREARAMKVRDKDAAVRVDR